MRQEPTPLEEYRDLDAECLKLARELRSIRERKRKLDARLDILLSHVLSPDMSRSKLMSYRLASELSGVPHETLRRRYGG